MEVGVGEAKVPLLEVEGTTVVALPEAAVVGILDAAEGEVAVKVAAAEEDAAEEDAAEEDAEDAAVPLGMAMGTPAPLHMA